MCLEGAFIAIEIKRPGKKPTELQEWNIQQIRKARGWSFWTDNLPDLQQKIEKIRLILNHYED
jgi:hypothetical protein